MRSVARALDGYTEDEMEIIGTRYDLMDDEELNAVLADRGSSTSDQVDVLAEASDGVLETPKARRTTDNTPFFSDETETAEEAQDLDPNGSSAPPLFPPSPPPNTRRPLAHPLRILSRAIRDLEDKVAQLVLDNEALQDQLTQSPAERTKQVRCTTKTHNPR